MKTRKRREMRWMSGSEGVDYGYISNVKRRQSTVFEWGRCSEDLQVLLFMTAVFLVMVPDSAINV